MQQCKYDCEMYKYACEANLPGLPIYAQKVEAVSQASPSYSCHKKNVHMEIFCELK